MNPMGPFITCYWSIHSDGVSSSGCKSHLLIKLMRRMSVLSFTPQNRKFKNNSAVVSLILHSSGRLKAFWLRLDLRKLPEIQKQQSRTVFGTAMRVMTTAWHFSGCWHKKAQDKILLFCPSLMFKHRSRCVRVPRAMRTTMRMMTTVLASVSSRQDAGVVFCLSICAALWRRCLSTSLRMRRAR